MQRRILPVGQRESQQSLTTRTRNKILTPSSWSSFSYGAQIDYDHQNSIRIGEMRIRFFLNILLKNGLMKRTVCAACLKKSFLLIFKSHQNQKKAIWQIIIHYRSIFLKNLRRYNSHFQMTLFGVKEIREGNFMPSFKVEGKVYHIIAFYRHQDKALNFCRHIWFHMLTNYHCNQSKPSCQY